MAAMLTYRSRNSFESKFGRSTPDPRDRRVVTNNQYIRAPSTLNEQNWAVHNHGNIHGRKLSTPQQTPNLSPVNSALSITALPKFDSSSSSSPSPAASPEIQSHSRNNSNDSSKTQESLALSSPVESKPNGFASMTRRKPLNHFLRRNLILDTKEISLYSGLMQTATFQSLENLIAMIFQEAVAMIYPLL